MRQAKLLEINSKKVEAAGIEPASEDKSQRPSTCLAGLLFIRLREHRQAGFTSSYPDLSFTRPPQEKGQAILS